MVSAGGGFQATVAPWDTASREHRERGVLAWEGAEPSMDGAGTGQGGEGSAGMAVEEGVSGVPPPARCSSYPHWLGARVSKLAAGASRSEEGPCDVRDFTCSLHPLRNQKEGKHRSELCTQAPRLVEGFPVLLCPLTNPKLPPYKSPTHFTQAAQFCKPGCPWKGEFLIKMGCPSVLQAAGPPWRPGGPDAPLC